MLLLLAAVGTATAVETTLTSWPNDGCWVSTYKQVYEHTLYSRYVSSNLYVQHISEFSAETVARLKTLTDLEEINALPEIKQRFSVLPLGDSFIFIPLPSTDGAIYILTPQDNALYRFSEVILEEVHKLGKIIYVKASSDGIDGYLRFDTTDFATGIPRYSFVQLLFPLDGGMAEVSSLTMKFDDREEHVLLTAELSREDNTAPLPGALFLFDIKKETFHAILLDYFEGTKEIVDICRARSGTWVLMAENYELLTYDDIRGKPRMIERCASEEEPAGDTILADGHDLYLFYRDSRADGYALKGVIQDDAIQWEKRVPISELPRTSPANDKLAAPFAVAEEADPTPRQREERWDSTYARVYEHTLYSKYVSSNPDIPSIGDVSAETVARLKTLTDLEEINALPEVKQRFSVLPLGDSFIFIPLPSVDGAIYILVPKNNAFYLLSEVEMSSLRSMYKLGEALYIYAFLGDIDPGYLRFDTRDFSTGGDHSYSYVQLLCPLEKAMPSVRIWDIVFDDQKEYALFPGSFILNGGLFTRAFFLFDIKKETFHTILFEHDDAPGEIIDVCRTPSGTWLFMDERNTFLEYDDIRGRPRMLTSHPYEDITPDGDTFLVNGNDIYLFYRDGGDAAKGIKSDDGVHWLKRVPISELLVIFPENDKLAAFRKQENWSHNASRSSGEDK